MRRLQAGALAGLMVLGASPGIAATGIGTERAQASLQVTVVVPLVLRMQTQAHPDTVEVTAEDIARGYVEVRAPVHMAIWSNARQGYSLFIAKHAGYVRTAHVAGLGGTLQVSDFPVHSARPSLGRGLRQDMLELAFRFDLDASARQGTYPWPMTISATPL